MQIERRSALTVGIVLSSAVGTYVISSLIIAIIKTGPAFYNISIGDIGNILTSLLTGAGVFYYVSVSIGRKQRRADFLCARIDYVLTVYRDIMNTFERCFGGEVSKSEQHRLKIVFRIASNELSSMNAVFADSGVTPSRSHADRMASIIDRNTTLKTVITDAPFSFAHVVGDEDESKALGAYEKIKNELNDLKLCLHQ